MIVLSTHHRGPSPSDQYSQAAKKKHARDKSLLGLRLIEPPDKRDRQHKDRNIIDRIDYQCRDKPSINVDTVAARYRKIPGEPYRQTREDGHQDLFELVSTL